MSPGLRSASKGASALLARLVLLATLGAVVAAAPQTSFAEGPTVSKEDKKRAGARFREGEALFQKHAYAEAAEAFEEAYRIAPHPSVLWNVVNAAVLAGQNARAATLCARLVAEAGDDKLREDARQKLAELRQKVAKLVVGGAKPDKLELDGKPAQAGEQYVEPGDHVIEATFGDKKQRRKLMLVPGSSERILLDAPAPDEAKTAKAPSPPPPPPPEKPASGKPLSSTWVYVGAGLTVALGGVATWSGLDTLSARKAYDDDPNHTTADLDAGKSKQTRTNILLASTAVVGLATVGIAVFATNWGAGEGGQAQAKLKLGPGSAWLEGTFL
jgi:tetratricopeptide (TPR) repeat protein